MRWDLHRNHQLLFGTVLVGFVGLSLVVAVGPALWVQSHARPLPSSEPLTATERRGLRVYLAEGCVYCHTQQVRPIRQDTKRYGRPSVPGDYARLKPAGPLRQTPTVLGTERTGPDLSDVGDRQPSAQWHHIHLYQPRAVVKDSIMPAFPWLYRTVEKPAPEATVVPVPSEHVPGSQTVVATERAEALVAYLLSRKQPPLPGREARPKARASADLGAQLFNSRCAACHQRNGEGLSGTFPPLAGDPVVTAKDPTRHIEIVLFGLEGKTIEGVSYRAKMPAWGEKLSNEEVAAVINHERTSWGNEAPTVTAEDVAKVRKQGEGP